MKIINLADFQISNNNQFILIAGPCVIENEKIRIETLTRPTSLNPTAGSTQFHFLAKKSFGIPEFWKKNPKFDGRGVKVGVLDDGVSPFHPGFKTTTDGKRKYIARNWDKSYLNFQMKKVSDVSQSIQIDFLKSLEAPHLFGKLNTIDFQHLVPKYLFALFDGFLQIECPQ